MTDLLTRIRWVRVCALLLAGCVLFGCDAQTARNGGTAPRAPTSVSSDGVARASDGTPMTASSPNTASGKVPLKAQLDVDLTNYTKPEDSVLRAKLSPLQYEVTQNAATEPPFANAYWNNHEDGLYVDVVSGEPLFSSRDKFDSGTGWPSFSKPLDPKSLVEHSDSSLGVTRTEVLSKVANSHLGHVFDDGPAPTNLRYCINSAALRFIPVDQLEANGYAAYRPLFSSPAAPTVVASDNACAVPAAGEAAGCATTFETAYLAGGCFWGMEEILRKIPGVVETEVGYTGGSSKNPTYEDVHTGTTGHAESVRIVFDPKKLSYEQLLGWFFRMHDPTTKNRQGNDIGSQYRSAIFYTSPEQQRVAEAVKARVDQSKKWGDPVVTEIVPATPFTPAEDYHQDYLQLHPDGYSCHYLRD